MSIVDTPEQYLRGSQVAPASKTTWYGDYNLNGELGFPFYTFANKGCDGGAVKCESVYETLFHWADYTGKHIDSTGTKKIPDYPPQKLTSCGGCYAPALVSALREH